MSLMSPRLDEMIPEDHLARVVVKAVDQLFFLIKVYHLA
jgi:hypothetical protein